MPPACPARHPVSFPATGFHPIPTNRRRYYPRYIRRKGVPFYESDRKTKEETDKVNQADTLIFQSEKQLTEYGDKISADKKEVIQKALSELKDAHKEKNVVAIDTALASLNSAWQAASEEMYKATQQAGSPAADGSASAGQENKSDAEVTDVDFEEVKEDKK